MPFTTLTIKPECVDNCRTIIMDIGDVLATPSLSSSTSIPPTLLRTILTSSTWGRYECGQLTELECYRLIAEEHSLDFDEVHRTITEEVRESITLNRPLFAFLRELKSELGTFLRLYIMSNISQPDINFLFSKHAEDWEIFDGIVPSSQIGMRKPALGFYRQVFDNIGGNRKDIVFVDDKAENVLAARSFGVHGVVYSGLAEFRRTIRCFVCNPIEMGISYLHANQASLDVGLIHGDRSTDRLAQMLASESFKELSIDVVDVPRSHLGHCDPAIVSGGGKLPLDVDFLVPQLLEPGYDQDVIDVVLRDILQLRDEDGIIRTFVDSRCGRLDPVVCANVLALFYSQGRGPELKETQTWIVNVLEHRSYLDGTHYYPKPESFLYSLSRLLQFCKDEALHRTLKPLLEERLQERIRLPGDAITLAMRIIACTNVGKLAIADTQQLLSMQSEDGSWPVDSASKNGSSACGDIEDRCVATILALKAITLARRDLT